MSPATKLLEGAIAAAWLLAAAPLALADDDVGCGDTSEIMLQQCNLAAQADYQLALAKCANLASRAERNACRREAAQDLQDALALCDDQFRVRQVVCGLLGDAPYDPQIDPRSFGGPIDNPYFPLKPGTTFFYSGRTADGTETDTFEVTRNTRVILGVTCVEVHDVVRLDGEVMEDTRDWFAQDKDGNVWYFGEASAEVEGGLVVSTEGSWEGGVDGAKPGIAMKAHPVPGGTYRQEFLLDTAEDIATDLRLDATVTVPYGTFKRCLETKEITPIDPTDIAHKFYAPGVGNVLGVEANGDRSELIGITR